MPTDYADLKTKLAALREQMTTAAKDFFENASKQLFTENPTLKSFSWTQYTPYFNDGNECVFSAHTDYPEVNGYDEYGYKTDGDEDIEAGSLEEHKRLVALVRDLLTNIEEDDFRTMFGDHVQVTVTRKGVEVEEYSHD